MDTDKVDLLLQYALAMASQADDPYDRRLGRIHLLKYVYIADLAHAKKRGITFTGARWQFYHYGPWDLAVFKRIAPVLAILGAHEFVWSSTRYESDTVRWSIDPERAEELLPELDRKLPVDVTLALKRAVRTFGNDTSELLHDVYTSAPMLHAAPGQFLDLTIASSQTTETPWSSAESTSAEPTAKELKKRKEAMRNAKAKFKASRASLAAGEFRSPPLEPIYDAIFFDGARQVDDLAGISPDNIEGEASISDAVWTSEVRKRGRLP